MKSHYWRLAIECLADHFGQLQLIIIDEQVYQLLYCVGIVSIVTAHYICSSFGSVASSSNFCLIYSSIYFFSAYLLPPITYLLLGTIFPIQLYTIHTTCIRVKIL